MGVVLLANLDPIVPTSMTRRIADLLLPAGGWSAPGGDAAVRLAGAAGLYRQEGGAELVAIHDVGGAPAMSTGMGTARLEQTAPGLFAPKRATQHLTCAAAGWQPGRSPRGAASRYVKLAPPGGAVPVTGHSHNAATGITAIVENAAGGLRLRIGTEAGQHRMMLRWVAPDLLVGLPVGMAQKPGWPPVWACTLQVLPDGLVSTRPIGRRSCAVVRAGMVAFFSGAKQKILLLMPGRGATAPLCTRG